MFSLSVSEPTSVHSLPDTTFRLITRPSLDRYHAFDLCLLHASAASGPLAIITPNEHVADLLNRCAGLPVQIVELNEANELRFFTPGDKNTVQAQQFRTVLWVEPPSAHIDTALERICERLMADGKLLVLAHGRVSSIRQSVERGGFRIETRQGLHAPASYFWGAVGLLLAQFKRDDLADRCHFKMRASYVVEGWQASLAPLVLLVAERSDAS